MIEVVRRNVSWIVRVAWVAMALLPNALTNDRLAVSIAGWCAWSLVAIATWLEHPISLTVVRAVSPVVVAHLALGLPDGNWEPARIAGVTCGVVALMVIAGGDYGSNQWFPFKSEVQVHGGYSDSRVLKSSQALIFPMYRPAGKNGSPPLNDVALLYLDECAEDLQQFPE